MKVRLRFNAPPGPDLPGFIEAEGMDGKSLRVGHWEQDPFSNDWFLVIEVVAK